MSLLQELAGIYRTHDGPFLIGPRETLRFSDLEKAPGLPAAARVEAGDVVAVIGDFSPQAIKRFCEVVDAGAVVVPLTPETRKEHPYFFESAQINWVIEDDRARRIAPTRRTHPLLDVLRRRQHPGLVLFSTGTTGRPKAILHDFSRFLKRYRVRRPAFRTLSFLMFDHIGGVNTLFHTLFNRGCLVTPAGRSPDQVMDAIREFRVELLPTSPTFLRLLLLSGALDRGVPESLRLVTYGTERMDPGTLERLCEQMPGVDFRQTYGMSELSILRIKSKSRNSLWMKIGGEGVQTRVEDGVLKIRAEHRMLGYLNAPSPFDAEGFYDTGDLVEQDGPFLRIQGRRGDIINVGGLKVLPAEVEEMALGHPDVVRAKVRGVPNHITGQHIELVCEPRPGVSLTRSALRSYLKTRLPRNKLPQSIRLGGVAFSHRFKQE